MACQSALEILSKFFFEMHQWEKKHYPIIRTLIESDAVQVEVGAAQKAAADELLEIYDRFQIGGKKNRSRSDMIMLEDPPAYDANPQIKEQNEVAADEIEFVVVENAGLLGTYRYKLKLKNEMWCITKREFHDPRKGWVSAAF